MKYLAATYEDDQHCGYDERPQ